MTAAVDVAQAAVLEAQEQVEQAKAQLVAIMALMAAAGRRSQLPADTAYPLLCNVDLQLQVALDQLAKVSMR